MKYNKGTFLIAPNKENIKGCKPIIQCVYFRLCDFSDKNYECFPSFQTIANCAGCSRRAVIDAIKELEKIGVIEKTARHNKNEQTSNLYHVVILDVGSAGGALPSAGDALPLVHEVHTELHPLLTTPTKPIYKYPKTPPKPKKKFIPPTIEQVVSYFRENGYIAAAGEKAWKYYNSAGWIDSEGKPVKSRKQKMVGVRFRDENKDKTKSRGLTDAQRQERLDALSN